MPSLLNVDCGTRGCGLALFLDRALMHAQYVSGIGGCAHPLLEVASEVGRVVAELAGALGKIDEVVIEIPQIYDARHQKGDQQDLVDLAFAAGAIADKCAPHCTSILLILPRDWKGDLPKDISEARSRGKLSAGEIACIDLPSASLAHNVWDSIGIGLWRIIR